ncbi:type 1 glutamine amidotransferase domain-containing protein [Paenactinomyces guangxiensis]|uniref:Type 1 glutamine amidotransferase n=1 Tax=Paenactinomyces guangxiensis TaxID=1490290 RepID=A0A7W1WPC5_9BACL|nr:type 1 glutamine amidotransferase domain-containing protein [Paenactinomyces guangxiensis]MBA4493597.1 type 1 glutamine amidotransferase [Paenactinomyces guangxiensis]MBH8590884.1 type 1 glutamine amidotransferase [Paenactinomyces guangxiensis]
MRLAGKKVLCFVEAEFEDLELWYPVLRLHEEGAEVHLAGPETGEYKGKYGVPVKTDLDFRQIKPEEYDGILIPGGWAPDKLRRCQEVLEAVRHAHTSGKVIGQICHAGWVLISAKILHGKRVTSTPGIRDDMENAGAIWVDEPVVVDGNLVSSRRPPDLPAYAKAFCDLLAKAR